MKFTSLPGNVAPTDVPCLSCGRSYDQWCKTSQGQALPGKPHKARKSLAARVRQMADSMKEEA